ncbi:MAG TPA: DoxX family protein [Abditibacteriaceae bacterium]
MDAPVILSFFGCTFAGFLDITMKTPSTQQLATAGRLGSGAIFVAAGLFKLALSRSGESVWGERAFAQMLRDLNVPLPVFTAFAICTLEVVGGAALLKNKLVRPFAALLACDMIGAIGLVGIPGKFGHDRQEGPYRVGSEPWRLPLEVGLLLMMIWLATRTDTEE